LLLLPYFILQGQAVIAALHKKDEEDRVFIVLARCHKNWEKNKKIVK
jgi:hypothetical protein